MSMLGKQIKELREAAFGIQGDLGRCLYRRKDVDKMQKFSDLLFEAANTIERLQELQGITSESRYTELFGTPERVARTLERLDVEWSDWCSVFSECRNCMFGQVDGERVTCWEPDDFSFVEWLRGDARGEGVAE